MPQGHRAQQAIRGPASIKGILTKMNSNDRQDIDPEGRYPSECLRVVEEWTRKALELLPGAELSRTRDAIQLDWGGGAGVVVVLTPEAVELRLPTVEWTCGAYGPAASSNLWRRVKYDKLEDDEERLGTLLRTCMAKREAQFRTCKYCGERVPPEHRMGRNVCHGCASKHEDVVF